MKLELAREARRIKRQKDSDKVFNQPLSGNIASQDQEDYNDTILSEDRALLGNNPSAGRFLGSINKLYSDEEDLKLAG